MQIKCEACGKDFEYSKESMEVTQDGEYEVQYFTCPSCHKRHLVLCIDAKMREMVNERRKIINQLAIAQKKQMYSKQISKLQRDDRKLKARQIDHMNELRPKGRAILEASCRPETGDFTD